jgi:hypothetical protein
LPAPPKRTFPGVISRLEVYTPQELQARLRFGGKTLRWAYANGLKSVWLGHVKVITGEDFYEFLRAQPRAEPGRLPGERAAADEEAEQVSDDGREEAASDAREDRPARRRPQRGTG